MISGYSIGYVNFTVILFLLSGLVILRLDVKGYELAGMKKEQKTARYLGWCNVIVGGLSLLANWVYQNMM